MESQRDRTPRWRSRNRKELKVFGWSRSWISDNTESLSLSRIFFSDSGCPVGSIFTANSGIPFEMLQFLLKLSMKLMFLAVHHDQCRTQKIFMGGFHLVAYVGDLVCPVCDVTI